MHNGTAVSISHAAQKRAQDAKLLRESGVYKLVVVDRQGNCLAYLLVWASFTYDAETDTHVCIADRDGGELMTIYTEGDIVPDCTTNTYVVTAETAALGLK
jgi:hypothetical protein